jgi:hypothetical protein
MVGSASTLSKCLRSSRWRHSMLKLAFALMVRITVRATQDNFNLIRRSRTTTVIRVKYDCAKAT